MAKKKRKKQSKAASAFLTIAIILCLGVMGYSAYRLISTALEYRRGTEEYDSLRQYTAEAEAGPETAEGTIVEEEEEEESKLPKCPIKVDWDSLKKINEDIIGWIYIGALDISYPVVKGEDNDYYLHRTFERADNFAGSIFVEYQNSETFNDPNTIVYGHNMMNGSMFGKLKNLTGEEELYKKDPYFWILTPNMDYVYHMFSLRVTNTDSDVYTLFHGTDQSFVEWSEKMKKESSVEIDLGEYEFTTGSCIATLSTCTGNDATRYVVQGLRLN